MIGVADAPPIQRLVHTIAGQPQAQLRNFSTFIHEYAETAKRNSFWARLVLGSIDPTAFPEQEFEFVDTQHLITITTVDKPPFPNIGVAFDKQTGVLSVLPKASDQTSVTSELFYTRLFLELVKSDVLTLISDDTQIFRLEITDEMRKSTPEIENRARIARKLAFLEVLFNVRFFLPDYIDFREVLGIEVLFRGATEGEFSMPATGSMDVPVESFVESSLQGEPNQWTMLIPGQDLLGVRFPTPHYVYAPRGVADTDLRRKVKHGYRPETIRLHVLDHQLHCSFPRWKDSANLRKNQALLTQLHKRLLSEESREIADLLVEPLASLTSETALEIAYGVLQFADFPDRYVFSPPTNQGADWKLLLGLTNRDAEPTWITDVVVDGRTGEVKFGLSFEAIRAEGKKVASGKNQ
jgi:hypothetical protein